MSNQGSMSVREAGKLGGTSTSKKHGRKHYESIGQKGGLTVSALYGHEHFEEIGRKGGRRVAELIQKGKEAAEGH